VTAAAPFDSSTSDAGRYPPLGSLGVIGDGRSAAVVYPDGQVGWFCPLRFDAEPVFWSLLDCSRGGRLAVRPVDDDARADFSYQPGTAVLAYD